MTPFYFGTSERRLFGIYEPASFGSAGRRAAVLCHPWGSEYLHAHRTIRQLATKLAAAGFHTLRFDFFGTGDSGGDMIDTDLEGWETDIELAVEEIKDTVGATQVTLIGLRLGAAVSMKVAMRLPRQIDALVLWDPVVRGEEYLRLLGVAARPGMDRRHPMPSKSGQLIEVQGFSLTPKMMHDIQSLDLGTLISSTPTRTLVVVTEKLPSHGALIPMPVGHGRGTLEIEIMAGVRPWIENSASTGMVPFGVIQRIVNWLG